jgi:hypothetical protein
MRKAVLIGGVVAALFALPQTSFAGFATSATGDVFIGPTDPPPVSALPGAIASDAYSIWNETQGTIGAPVFLDSNGAVGSYTGLSIFTPTVLATGTDYGSTMIHFDPVSDVVVGASAIINFSHKIIGIALRGGTLDATDIYGNPGTTYPTGFTQPLPDTRGLDFRVNDQFIISNGGKTIEVRFTANFSGFDQIRVFTAGVPEPSSLLVWTMVGAVVLGGAWWRRRPPAI